MRRYFIYGEPVQFTGFKPVLQKRYQKGATSYAYPGWEVLKKT